MQRKCTTIKRTGTAKTLEQLGCDEQMCIKVLVYLLVHFQWSHIEPKTSVCALPLIFYYVSFKLIQENEKILVIKEQTQWLLC